jgi:hypothetical protein
MLGAISISFQSLRAALIGSVPIPCEFGLFARPVQRTTMSTAQRDRELNLTFRPKGAAPAFLSSISPATHGCGKIV